MTQKIKKTTFIAFVLLALGLGATLPAYAAIPGDTKSGSGSSASGGSTASSDPDCNNPNPTANSLNSCVKNNPIVHDLNVIVNILSALVGVVVTAVIVLGGVQYAMAGDSPDAVSKAKQRITNGLIALAAFLLIYGFLQWIVPGGVFNTS